MVLFLNLILRGVDPILRGYVLILRWVVHSLGGCDPNVTRGGSVSVRSRRGVAPRS